MVQQLRRRQQNGEIFIWSFLGQWLLLPISGLTFSRYEGLEILINIHKNLSHPETDLLSQCYRLSLYGKSKGPPVEFILLSGNAPYSIYCKGYRVMSVKIPLIISSQIITTKRKNNILYHFLCPNKQQPEF